MTVFLNTLILLSALISSALSFVTMNVTSLIIAVLTLIMSIAIYANRDNMSLGTAIFLSALPAFTEGGLIIKVLSLVTMLLSLFMLISMRICKKKTHPYVYMSDGEMELEREEREKKARKGCGDPAYPAEEDESPSDEAVPEAAAETAPEEAMNENKADEAGEEAVEKEPAVKAVPGITEEISSCSGKAEEDDEDEEWISVTPRKPRLDDKEQKVLDALENGVFTSPRKRAEEKGAPEVMLIKEGKDPEKVTLERIFSNDAESFDPKSPLLISNVSGWGIDGKVRVLRYTLRNRSRRNIKYFLFDVSLFDIVKNAIRGDDTVKLEYEGLLEPGKEIIVDVPSKAYIRTRSVETVLRTTVETDGTVTAWADPERLLSLPASIKAEELFGDETDEFTSWYENEYRLGFRPSYAYETGRDGNSCTCPCCGEAMDFDDLSCPLCGAPKERFIFASGAFMKRCFSSWLDKTTKKRNADERKEKTIKEMKEEKERLEKKLENKNNNLKMWLTVLILIIIVGGVWFYYRGL